MEHTPTITAAQLMNLGYPQSPALGAALAAATQLALPANETLVLLTDVLANPAPYTTHPVLMALATMLITEKEKEMAEATIALRPQPLPYNVYGAEHIDTGATEQMTTAMKLPVTVAGALMPDAHKGYGLPIGGVLATNNAIIPYGVGVDIGCRMALTVFDVPESHFLENQSMYKRELIAFTKFGAGGIWQHQMKASHAVLEDALFGEIPLLQKLQQKATEQLGTSGGGNHFAEWGIMEFAEADEQLNVPKGRYLALLTHSGSRGLGATVAGHYTRLARELCRLPQEAANLAWLNLDSAEGQEYWLAMNLAGSYASACHEVIHERLTKAIGGQVLARVENHHNFAWKEQLNGQEVIVHRKGATPAGKGVMGIIPGSMATPGFLVRGKGEVSAVHSASHGAGRQLSRTQATKTFKRNEINKMLRDMGITLIGAGADEAPGAYKDIHAVMAAQTDLVDVVATFSPRMVRMADDGSRED
jgi:tRNA-splicing ligase RtcB